MIRRIGIGADLEQGADERQWAVIDGVFEARSDFERHRPIRHGVGILDRGAQRFEVTKAKSSSILLNLSYLAHRSASVSVVRPTLMIR
jgi:hypothetical protein